MNEENASQDDESKRSSAPMMIVSSMMIAVIFYILSPFLLIFLDHYDLGFYGFLAPLIPYLEIYFAPFQYFYENFGFVR